MTNYEAMIWLEALSRTHVKYTLAKFYRQNWYYKSRAVNTYSTCELCKIVRNDCDRCLIVLTRLEKKEQEEDDPCFYLVMSGDKRLIFAAIRHMEGFLIGGR